MSTKILKGKNSRDLIIAIIVSVFCRRLQSGANHYSIMGAGRGRRDIGGSTEIILSTTRIEKNLKNIFKKYFGERPNKQIWEGGGERPLFPLSRIRSWSQWTITMDIRYKLQRDAAAAEKKRDDLSRRQTAAAAPWNRSK